VKDQEKTKEKTQEKKKRRKREDEVVKLKVWEELKFRKTSRSD
jgi:hypothetical protein